MPYLTGRGVDCRLNLVLKPAMFEKLFLEMDATGSGDRPSLPLPVQQPFHPWIATVTQG